MKTESKQKLSALGLNAVVTYAVAALIVAVIIIAAGQHDFAGLLASILVIACLALVLGFLELRFMARSGCRFLNDSMLIARPFRPLQVDYDSVSRVERVTRANGSKTEKLRVTFKHDGRDRVVSFTPECPPIVLSELLSRCPRLTSSKTQRVKRDRTFRVAKKIATSSVGESSEPW